MGIILEAEARKVLEEYQSPLVEGVRSAWLTWQAKLAPHFVLPRGRVSACAISGLIEKELRMRFGAMQGVHLVDKGQRLLLWVRGKMLLRFKKVDGEYHTRTYPTLTAQRFDGQQPLALYEDLPRVTIGYRLNRLKTDLLEVPVVFSVGDSVKWAYTLYRSGEEQLPLLLNQPMPTSDRRDNLATNLDFTQKDTAGKKKKRITVKKPQQQEKKESGEGGNGEQG